MSLFNKVVEKGVASYVQTELHKRISGSLFMKLLPQRMRTAYCWVKSAKLQLKVEINWTNVMLGNYCYWYQ